MDLGEAVRAARRLKRDAESSGVHALRYGVALHEWEKQERVEVDGDRLMKRRYRDSYGWPWKPTVTEAANPNWLVRTLSILDLED